MAVLCCCRFSNLLWLWHLSAIVPHRSYVVHLDSGLSYILMIASPVSSSAAQKESTPLHTPLKVYQSLLTLIAQNTSVPQPTPLLHSESNDVIPNEYLILTSPKGTPLAELRKTGKLSERQNVMVDLQIGQWMREIHDRVQNDWFGVPKTQSPQPAIPSFMPSIPGLASFGFGQAGADEDEPSYSWQETFTSLLESLMQSAETLDVAPGLSYQDLRKALGRAIGSFLFDDCEVPSLVSFLGDEGSVFVDIPDSPADGDFEPTITSLLPPTYALYGDPLLETFFLTSGPTNAANREPSQALLEGYGGNPIVFRRQRTKRMWYDVFLALSVLLSVRGGNEHTGDEESETRVQWARQRLAESAEHLKDAPCY